MNESPLQFDIAEEQIIARAANPELTRRRILYSVVMPLILIALLLILFWRDSQPRTLLWLFVGYVAFNMLEKVMYGFGVLTYKSVIRKLLARVKELETKAS